MSKKPSENQKPGKNFSESFFRLSNTSTENNEENSLERRLFILIGNELRRTTAQNEFASLENRIIRILRNEFVNDIMMEINTSNDEISTFFNRFIRSVPELNELYGRTEGNCDKESSTEKSKSNELTSKGQKNSRKSFCARLDENNIRVVLEMFRAPILVTCRACEDMRRIIRSGRRMIRQIQLIAAMRSDLNTLRRIDMKCVEDQGHVGNLRNRRQASTLGNWRHLFRRRCRNIQPFPCSDRSLYFVVFDRPEKPRLVQISPKAKYTMLIKLCNRGKGNIPSPKHRTQVWDEFRTKTEIGKILQAVRSVCSFSSSSLQNSAPQTILLPNSVEHPSPTQEDKIQINILNNESLTENTQESDCVLNPSLIPSSLLSSVSESATFQVRNEVQSQNTPSLPSSLDQQEISEESTSSMKSPPSYGEGEDGHLFFSPFSATLRTGSASPQDVTVVLYSDRVLVASVTQRSVVGADGWSGCLQRRWILPEHVNEDRIRCFLGGGSLIITVSPCTDIEWTFGSDLEALGPPSREPYPYPHPYTRPS